MMPIFDLYSKRRKAERGEQPDVYTYDKIPNGLRVQIIHIWGDAIGNPLVDGEQNIRAAYQEIVEVLRREYQVFVLTKNNHAPHDSRYAFAELCEFFLSEKDTDRVLDVIELTAKVIDTFTRRFDYRYGRNFDETADGAIFELNNRFRENAIGYEFSDGRMLRIDSQLVHSEIVKPVLAVLRDKRYANAQKEFLDAHDNYRHGKNGPALVDCNKAFESTMKIICSKRKWTVSATASASQLIKVCYDNGLIPAYWQNHFAGLRSVLESGVPTARNKQGGHGAGAAPVPALPDHLVAYVLHLTAATILFLAEAERTMP
jgi:hypothetical protein